MKRYILSFFLIILCLSLLAQSPQPAPASHIFQQIKKLKVLGSVLYIAAHPDDENTRLIAYLANDKLYRTGYLSLTRGDGGQNLIGEEQGIELGLIRTQELLAARRIDGGEQFFTRAYDFGFSKTPNETFEKWDKEKVLADVVWVIRKFRPDVIITRFPSTGEGGHGHHTASAILAIEAFEAAADSKKFTNQLKYVKPWQAKRMLWNTFNFGGNNTTDASQFNVNVGGYNSFLGKSYGEIAAQSRSQHKSQGFGSAASRENSHEFFKTLKGNAPKNDLFDDVNISWKRIGNEGASIDKMIDDIINKFDYAAPQKSVTALVALYKTIEKFNADDYWTNKKKEEVQQLIMNCTGLYIDAFTKQPYAVQTGSIDIEVVINNRAGTTSKVNKVFIDDISIGSNSNLEKNKNVVFSKNIEVPLSKEITQPYWLKHSMDNNLFHVDDLQLIGLPDVQPAYTAKLEVEIEGTNFVFEKPIQYKYTDPVKGEVYQPLCVLPPATVTSSPKYIVFNNQKEKKENLQTQLHANVALDDNMVAGVEGVDYSGLQNDHVKLDIGKTKNYNFAVTDAHKPTEVYSVAPFVKKINDKDSSVYNLALKNINYDHIPSIRYFYTDFITALNIDLKTVGKKIGYIPGAGDKVVPVLERMGYAVTILDKNSLAVTNLKMFDAIITGVRAYNTNEWMFEYYDALMDYVKEGGNLIVQYNTSNNNSSVKSKIGPYDFEISRNRITNENADVKILDAKHKAFNFPNKITNDDFKGWIQERSIYHAGSWDDQLTPLLSMADPNEDSHQGSLLVGKYGKGYFTYTGLVFFRELPAGVPGALRLMANLIALNQEANGE